MGEEDDVRKRDIFFFMSFEHKWDPQISLFLFVLMGVRETFHS